MVQESKDSPLSTMPSAENHMDHVVHSAHNGEYEYEYEEEEEDYRDTSSLLFYKKHLIVDQDRKEVGDIEDGKKCHVVEVAAEEEEVEVEERANMRLQSTDQVEVSGPGAVKQETVAVEKDEFTALSPETGREKSRKERRASLKHKSTELAAFANLIKANIGSGILGMPYAFLNGGLALGLVSVVVMMVITIHSTLLLVRCKEHINARIVEEHRKKRTYGQISRVCFGSIGSLVVESVLVFTQGGFCIAYLIFIGKNMSNLLPMLQSWHYILMTLIILFPMLLLRKLKYLSVLSIISELALLVGMGIVFYYDAIYFQWSSFQRIKLYDLWRYPVFFGITLFGFEGIGLALPIHGNMKRPRNFPRVLTVAMIIIALSMICFGAFGYLAFTDRTEDVITLNLPDGILATIVKIGLMIALLLTYPIQAFPITEMFDHYLLKIKLIPERWMKYLGTHAENIFRILVLALTACLAILGSESFGLILSLIGGLGGSFLAFVFPNILHLKLFWGKIGWVWLARDALIALFGIVGAAASTFVSIRSIIEHFEGK